MNKSELINKWQKEIDKVNADHKTVLGIDFTYDTEISLISDFINDLKNLSGNTVKLVNGCHNCCNDPLDSTTYPCSSCDAELSQWQPE